MNPIIVGTRIYTDLSAAVADQPPGESFTYSEARMAPPTIPPGELIADLVANALWELNPQNTQQQELWDMYKREIKYECHKVSSKLDKFAQKAPTWVATNPQVYEVSHEQIPPLLTEEEE